MSDAFLVWGSDKFKKIKSLIEILWTDYEQIYFYMQNEAWMFVR